jgi:hypothetical protein
MRMMKGKLHSPSTHFFLIVLVARSGWPFYVYATRALFFLLSLSRFFFLFSTTRMVDGNDEVIRVD